jgi:hypothetical protein
MESVAAKTEVVKKYNKITIAKNLKKSPLKENFFFFRNCCAIYVLCKLKKLKYLFNLLRYYINYVCGLGSKYGDNL